MREASGERTTELITKFDRTWAGQRQSISIRVREDHWREMCGALVCPRMADGSQGSDRSSNPRGRSIRTRAAARGGEARLASDVEGWASERKREAEGAIEGGEGGKRTPRLDGACLGGGHESNTKWVPNWKNYV